MSATLMYSPQTKGLFMILQLEGLGTTQCHRRSLAKAYSTHKNSLYVVIDDDDDDAGAEAFVISLCQGRQGWQGRLAGKRNDS